MLSRLNHEAHKLNKVLKIDESEFAAACLILQMPAELPISRPIFCPLFARI